MSYPLRLPQQLDADARARCERLGISLNALICVALDAYLSGRIVPVPVPAPASVDRKPAPQPALSPATPTAAARIERARRLGIPEGMEQAYDLDDYAKFVAGVDPVTGEPLTDQQLADIDAAAGNDLESLVRSVERSKGARRKPKP